MRECCGIARILFSCINIYESYENVMFVCIIWSIVILMHRLQISKIRWSRKKKTLRYWPPSFLRELWNLTSICWRHSLSISPLKAQKMEKRFLFWLNFAIDNETKTWDNRCLSSKQIYFSPFSRQQNCVVRFYTIIIFLYVVGAKEMQKMSKRMIASQT